MTPTKPTVVWQHGNWRIVAVSFPDDADHGRPPGVCVLEMRSFDALENESWLEVLSEDVSEIARVAIITLVEEVVLKLDVLPLWVREFMNEQRKQNDSDEEEGGGVA
jgi:hypothetical protein